LIFSWAKFSSGGEDKFMVVILVVLRDSTKRKEITGLKYRIAQSNTEKGYEYCRHQLNKFLIKLRLSHAFIVMKKKMS
jgi:thiamine pyrophosphokinase